MTDILVQVLQSQASQRLPLSLVLAFGLGIGEKNSSYLEDWNVEKDCS